MADYHKLEQGLTAESAAAPEGVATSGVHEHVEDRRMAMDGVRRTSAGAVGMLVAVGALLVVMYASTENPNGNSKGNVADNVAPEAFVVVNPSSGADALRIDECAGRCAGNEASLECRSCWNRMSFGDFCHACTALGLNDVGCRMCERASDEGSNLIGGDANEHGCRASAGYHWCDAMSSCIRPWEHQLRTKDEFANKCAATSSPALFGGDADSHGCRPSAGYHWCASMASCVRPWEHGLRSEAELAEKCTPQSSLSEGADRDSHGCRASAGFKWCESKSACIRSWEHGITSPAEFMQACTPSVAAAVGGAKVHLHSAPDGQILGRSNQALVGGDLDAHGCRPSAGYSWCEAMHSCIRPWEHGITTKEEFAQRCTPPTAENLLGGDVDEHGCIGSAGYRWCESQSSCVRSWEFGIHSEEDFAAKCGSSPTQTRWCSCPPSEALWQCTEDEFEAVQSGTTCEFYRTQQMPAA